MPSKISSNAHSDITKLISSFKKLKPSKEEQKFIGTCIDNFDKFKQSISSYSGSTELNDSSLSHSKTESKELLEEFEKKFRDTFNDIIELKKDVIIHLNNESLLRLMHLMSCFTTLTTIATILAILIFLPVIQTVALLLSAVLISLFVIFQISLMLLNDDSPVLSNLKEKIECSFHQLEALSTGYDEESLDGSMSSEDSEHDETVEDKNTPPERANDTSSESVVSVEHQITPNETNSDERVPSKSPSQQSFLGRNGLFLELHAEAANNNTTDHDYGPSATSTP